MSGRSPKTAMKTTAANGSRRVTLSKSRSGSKTMTFYLRKHSEELLKSLTFFKIEHIDFDTQKEFITPRDYYDLVKTKMEEYTTLVRILEHQKQSGAITWEADKIESTLYACKSILDELASEYRVPFAEVKAAKVARNIQTAVATRRSPPATRRSPPKPKALTFFQRLTRRVRRGLGFRVSE
jgi:hypothetical protein